MKKILFQTIKLIALFAISFGVVMYAKENLVHLFNNRVDAAGALTFNIGVANGDPIFTFNNIAPGFSENHTVTANNGDTVARTTGVKGIKTAPGILDEALLIEISQNGTMLYGPKKLSEFFADSQTVNGIVLSQIAPGDSADYEFSVTFDTDAGNDFQNQTISFDLAFGIVTDIPLACEGMKFKETIFGTAENDSINGGAGNQLIIAFDGNDTIDGGAGNDCIVGGNGNNQIQGGAGNDTVIAGDGNNEIDGGAGKDDLSSGNGDNAINGNAGNDRITSGSGDDRLTGGAGNDTLEAGGGSNTIDGQTGRDTCVNGAMVNCER